MITDYVNHSKSNISVVIPNWLSQTKIISISSKFLYGRLMVWCNRHGDCFRSSKNLALEIGVSEKTVRNSLKELKDNDLIHVFQKKSGGTNYYKFPRHGIMNAEIVDQLLTATEIEDKRKNACDINEIIEDYKVIHNVGKSYPPHSEILPTPLVNVTDHKKKEEDKKEINTSSVKTELDKFDIFYDNYPKHEGQATAQKAWDKIIKKNPGLADTIIKDVMLRRVQHEAWAKAISSKDNSYIPMPATYLNGERWNDAVNSEKYNVNVRTQQAHERAKLREVEQHVQQRNNKMTPEEKKNGIKNIGSILEGLGYEQKT